MDVTPFKLLLLDAASHAILIADGPSGKILGEIPLPPALSPVTLAALPAAGVAFVALAGPEGSGALCRLSLAGRELDRLPLALPQPAQLALAPGGQAVYFADNAGVLYVLTLASLTLETWGRPADCGACAGLTVLDGRLWGVWETDAGGLLAALGPAGEQEAAYRLGGMPTSLGSDRSGRLLIPFTATSFSGEGLLVVDTHSGASAIIPILCSRCAVKYRTYPVHAAGYGDTVYVACEDSAALAVIDLAAGELTGTIPLRHSLSRLHILDGGRFAVATSNASAELGLIDLVNRRPLAFTASGREILGPFALVG